MPNQNHNQNQPPLTNRREQDHVLQEILRRLIRTESRVSQTMLHLGMKHDGRNPIQPGART